MLKNKDEQVRLPEFANWNWTEKTQFGEIFHIYCRQRKLDGIADATLIWEWENILNFWKYLVSIGFDRDELGVSKKEIESYSRYVNENEGISRNGKINRLRSVKAFYRKLCEMGKIRRNPAEDLNLPKEDNNQDVNILTVKQMKRLLELPNIDTAIGIRDRTMMELAYSCGLRRSDLSDMTEDAFDDKYETIRVIGKGDKETVLPLTRMASHFSKFYMAEVRPMLNKKLIKYAFVNQRGGKLTGHQVSVTIKKYMKECGFHDGIRMHSIRASICTHLAQYIDLRYLQDFMRHTKIDTLTKYLNPDQEQILDSFLKYNPRS